MDFIIAKKNISIFWVFFVIFADIAIILNIPYLRQFTGFMILTFFPGLLILEYLNVDKIDFSERLVLSIGLSISFVMIGGLLLNYLLILFNFNFALPLLYVLIPLNILLSIIPIKYILSYESKPYIISTNKLNPYDKLFFIPAFIFPGLSVLSINIMNRYNNNELIYQLIFLISLYTIFISIFNKILSNGIYPLAILSISLSLVSLMALRSSHILGADSHGEYLIFISALNSPHWSIFEQSLIGSCLSVTTLPVIYQIILNIPTETMFKNLYPLLFFASPLIIFQISKNFVNNLYAFLAALFFMFHRPFLLATANARTVIAILFIALFFMVLFNNNINKAVQKVLLIIFFASCIISHYSTTYISFIILLIYLIISKFTKLNNKINFATVALFFIMLFLWYGQLTNVAFNSGIYFIFNVLDQFNKMFLLESRDSSVGLILGYDIAKRNLTSRLEFILSWTQLILVVIGISFVFIRDILHVEGCFFLKKRFNADYFTLSFVCLLILLIAVAIPFISVGYALDRLMQTTFCILSIYFIIGVMAILDKGSAAPNPYVYLTILLVLIPYLWCITGVAYNIEGDHKSIILNSDGDEYDKMYIYESEVSASKWLKNIVGDYSNIYTDCFGTTRLISQGGIRTCSYASLLIEKKEKMKSGYFYLRYNGVINGKLLDINNVWHNLSDYEGKLGNNYKIYANGGSEIFS